MKNTKKGWIRELKEPDCFRNYILVFGMALVLFGLSVFSWLKEEDSFSESERRVLKKFPKISVTTVMNGKFMKDFESYSLDQFPFRDRFRGIKAWTSYNILRKKDNNDIYLVQDHLSKMEYLLQSHSHKCSMYVSMCKISFFCFSYYKSNMSYTEFKYERNM